MKNENATFGNLITVIVLGSLQFLSLGYIVTTMYKWFLLPLGLPNIPYSTCVGILVLGNILVYRFREVKETKSTLENVAILISYTFTEWVFFGFAALVYHFC